MKYKIKKKITVECTLDSSEAIMFTQGGKHTCVIPVNSILKEIQDQSFDDEKPVETQLEFTIQLQRSEQGRFDFITAKQEWRPEEEQK